MNRTAIYLSAMTVIVGLPLLEAGAQSVKKSLPAEILACANEKDAIRRLSCYDREVAAARKPAEAPAAPPVPVEEAVPMVESVPAMPDTPTPDAPPVAVEQPAPVVESVPAMSDTPAPAVPPPAETGPVAATAVEATVEGPVAVVPAPPAGKASEQQAPQATNTVDDFGYDRSQDDITATVVALQERPYGELVISLDNGQVWEQKHVDRRFRLDLGEIVTVRKGQVAGYRLSGTSNRSIQVKRIR